MGPASTLLEVMGCLLASSAVSLPARLNRPEYLFRPSAVIRRLRAGRDGIGASETVEDFALPWSRTISVFPDELGHSVMVSGVFDLCVTESIHRLLDKGDFAVDVGANVGYITSLIATRIGPEGSVLAFEPHPKVFELLERNVARWNADDATGALEARRLAISSEAGIGHLNVDANSASHMGLASLREGAEGGAPEDYEVELARLDDLVGDRKVQLLKIDVEGHELEVLRGAESLLSDSHVRDVVFEDHGIYPTPPMTFLEERGMTVLTLRHSLLGPLVHPVQEGPAPPGWPGPNYLATLDPDRALARLSPRGWRSLNRPKTRQAL